LVTVPDGTPLGTKMNLACSLLETELVAKWDDDDWYAESYLRSMVASIEDADVAFLQPFVFLLLQPWELRWSDAERCSGATLVFRRHAALRRPFRDVRSAVDAWFLEDQRDGGASIRSVFHPEIFCQLRHFGPHVWQKMPDGTPMADYLSSCRPVGREPRAFLDRWSTIRLWMLRERRAL
jgi:hypothetical protein